MIYAVFSDVHANVSALKRVLEDAKALGAERLLCLGDVVGYGPQPAETVDVLRASGATVLAGNHDDAVSGRISAEDFIDLAGEAVRRHREMLSAGQLEYLKTLPHVATFGAVRATHGDFLEPAAFNYVDCEAVAADNFTATDFELGFVGHTHEPCLYLTGQSGNVYRLPPQDFYLEKGKRYLVNPGSVGYPRATDGQCLSSYLIYDSRERLIRFRFLPFAVSSVMQRGFDRRPVFGVRSGILSVGLLLLLLGTAIVYKSTFLRSSPPEEHAPLVTNEVVKVVTNRVTLSQPPANSVEASGDLLDRRSLDIPLGHHFLRANIRLASGSSCVQLVVTYADARGRAIGEEATIVKSASKQRRRIPAGATRADLRLKRIAGLPPPTIAAFAPETEGSAKRRASRLGK